MYARLRGVASAHIEHTVEDLLQRIDLAEYADRQAASRFSTLQHLTDDRQAHACVEISKLSAI